MFEKPNEQINRSLKSMNRIHELNNNSTSFPLFLKCFANDLLIFQKHSINGINHRKLKLALRETSKNHVVSARCLQKLEITIQNMDNKNYIQKNHEC